MPNFAPNVGRFSLQSPITPRFGQLGKIEIYDKTTIAPYTDELTYITCQMIQHSEPFIQELDFEKKVIEMLDRIKEAIVGNSGVVFVAWKKESMDTDRVGAFVVFNPVSKQFNCKTKVACLQSLYIDENERGNLKFLIKLRNAIVAYARSQHVAFLVAKPSGFKTSRKTPLEATRLLTQIYRRRAGFQLFRTNGAYPTDVKTLIQNETFKALLPKTKAPVLIFPVNPK